MVHTRQDYSRFQDPALTGLSLLGEGSTPIGEDEDARPVMNTEPPRKPLGRKSYGHIPHLPGSRMGPGDHHCHEGQARICTEKARDKHDLICVEQKYDGGCVAAARIGDSIVALGRAGYLASSSKYEQHHLWAAWVAANETRFRALIDDGERAVGEWLAQAHGTRYALEGMAPFVLFDLMRDEKRLTVAGRHSRNSDRLGGQEAFTEPQVVSCGPPVSIAEALAGCVNTHGAIDPIEGCVWRVERQGKVDYLTKFVLPTKVDGCYLPELTGGEAVWNWQPE